MRKLTLLRSNRRFVLLGLAAVMTILALTVPATPASAGCFEFCNGWSPTGDCCWGTIVRGRWHHTCTDGFGHWCEEFMCSGACAV